MKIVLLVNRDLASTVALNYLLPGICHHDISVFMSDRVGKHNHDKPKPLVDLAVVEQGILNHLISAIPPATDEVENREKQVSCWYSMPVLAKKYHFDLAVENLINRAEGVESISVIDPDLIISIRYGVILKDQVISVPRLGVINLHSGLLPDYRGVMATFWAMLAGETQVGTTLHFIDDASIDTGRIIGNTRLHVDPGKPYLDHVLQLYVDGCQLIVETVAKMAKGDVPMTSPQTGGGQYFTFPNQQDLDDFADKGLSLFDLTSVLSVYQRFTPASRWR